MIKLIPLDRSLEVHFSRTLSIDFDKVLKTCLQNVNRTAQVRFIQDNDFNAVYKVYYRPRKNERAKIRTYLFNAAGLPEPPAEKRKKGGGARSKTFIGLTNNQSDTISGFSGNLVFQFKYLSKNEKIKELEY